MHTYFVSDGLRIKIGKTNNVKRRLTSLQTAHANPLRVLLLLPGDREKEFQEQFKRYRYRGEWYRPTRAILKFIADANNEPFCWSFCAWLEEQKERGDDIGRFALVVASDPAFPKISKRLHRLLDYYEDLPQLREVAKYAYRRWRIETQQMSQRPSVAT